jgi:plastocyanin
MVLLVALLPTSSGQDAASVVQGVVCLKGEHPRREKLMPDHDETDVLRMYPGGVPYDPVEVDKDNRVKWAFVYVKKGLEGKSFDVPKEAIQLSFDHFRLKPRVVGIMVGQTLTITNADSVIHSAHAMPLGEENKETNDVLEKGDQAKRTFVKPELGIVVLDDRHREIARAWINVVSHPYYCITGENGEYQIKGLPPGKYTLEVWQEHCTPVTREIEVGEKESKTVNFELEASKDKK